MNLSWWCSGISDTNWNWNPIFYPGIWILIAIVSFSYFQSVDKNNRKNKKTLYFIAGIILFWIFTDWPIGPIGAGYLLYVHVLQYLVYTFIAAPLIIISLPDKIYKKICNSKIKFLLQNSFLPFFIINFSLIITHIPYTADILKNSQIGTMIIDFIWMSSALLFWLWIDPQFNKNNFIPYPLRIFYIFALSILPAIPGAFFVFNKYPIYATYEFAVPISSLSPLADQEIAGLIMWAGSTPILLAWLGIIFYIWQKSEEKSNQEMID
ncbi:MAG: putative membrane protein [Chloroflexi bacterium]|jgi:cytochrome c oxidase assembly factor CtaG|nr:MAG: putative membrane protein [Chloroflexota bacterium]|tara:strand:+ start:4961 stop:5758 length:798 start_codon:yes stop_codon:yes gene_type:complete